MGFFDRLQHAWSAFTNKNTQLPFYPNSSFSRPDRIGLSYNVDKTIVSSIYNRIAVDASAVSIVHAKVDENGKFLGSLKTNLNARLTGMANKDQTGRDFIKDCIISLCDEGCIAIVPTHTDLDPEDTSSFKIDSMRVGKIEEWFPDSISVRLYNEDTGNKETVVVPKSMAAIVENPFYEVMNCKNSALQRLISKLNLLDKLDNEAGSGKLDIIIQLPYTVRSELRKKQAEERRKDIEMQLVGSKYGIAYIDSTEHVTQLNRPAENNLLSQIKDLTQTVYSQIGISQSIMDGTADEQTMINYFNSTIEPFLSVITLAMTMKFITPTARTQGQTVYFYRNPFKIVPVEKVAEMADKFVRNEILSPNEFRAIIGYKPNPNPKSDELRNPNLNQQSNPPQNQNVIKDKEVDTDV